ncbi:MAG: type II toxin-antitoxin system HicB family antitoxin [Bacillota bacterium]
MSVKVTVVIQKEDNWYVAKCIENSVASQGKTVEEAMANLKEALELYYEDMPKEEITSRQMFVTTLEVTV